MKININNGVTAPNGFKAAGVHCGIKKKFLKKRFSYYLFGRSSYCMWRLYKK